MKKTAGILSIFLLLFLAGCSTSKTPEESNTKEQAVNYQSLPKREKRDIYFKFHKSKSKSDYAVSMTVKNDSKKDVRFYLTKFMIMNSYDSDLEISSGLHKVIVVEPNSKVTVNNLFDHISHMIFDDSSGYYYLDNNHLLANAK